MKQAEPFQIQVEESVLTDLKERLVKTRWTDEPENANWNYGTNPGYLRELVEYWLNEYNWRTHETLLNRFPQFRVRIDGVGIHFIHIKGKGNSPKPLLLTHGWPDSFYRFYKVIPMLDDFDLIIPSIPGFGFSDHKAMNADQVAILWAKLMGDVLGYTHFYAAGGDMGTPITKSLANQYPEAVKAIHLTDVGYPNGSEDWSQMTQPEQEFGQLIQQWWFAEGAFNMIQSTKPQTLGYALNDSPVGLASWILEKFYAWSDNKGNIETRFTKDELLTNIMIYWVSQTINSSIRMYLENARAVFMAEEGPLYNRHVSTPTGVALFPGEAQFPEEWAKRMVNLKSITIMEKGGHFSAMEEPELWADNLKTFFKGID